MRRHVEALLVAAALGVGSATLVLASPTTAAAQGIERDAQARELFERGRSAWDAEDYGTAERLWARAFQLSGRPELLFDLGNARLRLGQLDSAESAYRHFLEIAPADSPERAEVAERLSEIDTRRASGERGSSRGGASPFDGHWAAWVAGGTTLATAAVGAGLSVDGASCGEACGGSRPTADAGGALLGSAALLAVVSVVVWFVEDQSGRPTPVEVGADGVRVRF